MDYPIEITIETFYIPEHSEPNNHYYVFDYKITIINHSNEAMTLLSRHWIITDGNSHKREVSGSVVAGQQPIVHAKEAYHYTSQVNFSTPVGSMYGSYYMKSELGQLVDVSIAPFSFVVPGALH